jgi:hypothetical protein
LVDDTLERHAIINRELGRMLPPQVEVQMKIAILLNRRHAKLRTFGKQVLNAAYSFAHGEFENISNIILPEYDSFGRVLDPSALVLGIDDQIDVRQLRGYDLLIWEWGWTTGPPSSILRIRNDFDIPTLMFPGPLDRFWRELDYHDISQQMAAAEITDAIGVMLRDTSAFYQCLVPTAHVFHMPVPVDVDYFESHALPVEHRNKQRLLLTAPTRFTGMSSQLPIATYLAFKNLIARKPGLEGICFTYSDEERTEAETILRELGLSKSVAIESYLRPVSRYLRTINSCHAGMYLSQGLVQGRTSMVCACLCIPMVLGSDVETHHFLYPRTTVGWYDPKTAADMCLRLLEDDEFHASVSVEARERVSYYSVDRCRQRMREGIDLAMQRRAARRRGSTG